MSLPPNIANSLRGDAVAILRRMVVDDASVQHLADEVLATVSGDPAKTQHAIAWVAATACSVGLKALADGHPPPVDVDWVALLEVAPVAQRTVLALIDACGYSVEDTASRTYRPAAEVQQLWSDAHEGTTKPPRGDDAESESEPPGRPDRSLVPEPQLALPRPAPTPAVAAPAPPTATPPPLADPSPSSKPPRRWHRPTNATLAGYLVIAVLAFSAGLALRSPGGDPSVGQSSTKVGDPASTLRDGGSEACGDPRANAASGAVPLMVNSDASVRSGRLIAGTPSSTDVPRALLIDLPDTDEKIDEHTAVTGFDALADQQHLVVATLTAQSGPGQWDPAGSADQNFIDDAITQIAGSACIDLDRVILAGVGSGAEMAASFVCRHPDTARGLIVVSLTSTPPSCATPPLTSVFMAQVAPDLSSSWVTANGCPPAELSTVGPLSIARHRPCRSATSSTIVTVEGTPPRWPGEIAPALADFVAGLPS